MNTKDLLQTWLDIGQENRSASLGPSDAGSCRKALAFRLHSIPPTDVSESGAAMVGTMIHEAYATAIKTQFPSDVRGAEVPVPISGLKRSGTADDVDYANRIVTDLKTLDPSRFDAWKDYGPPEAVWEQISLYVLGLDEQYPTEADPLTGISWLMRVAAVCRRTGRIEDYVEPWDKARAQNLRDHLVALEADLLANDPDDAPKDGKGRDSAPCSWCDWATRCLGETDPEPNPADLLSEAQKEEARIAAEEYLTALATKNEADARQKTARTKLADIVGDVGGYVIKWSGGREKTEPDSKAALELLQELNLPLPEKTTKTSARISVHRT